MTTSMDREAIDHRASRADAGIRSDAAARLVARISRSLWLRDRAVAELRWAAVTLSTMAGLGVLAKVIDPSDAGFDLSVLLLSPLAVIAIAAGWSTHAGSIMATRFARTTLGPLVVGVAMVATGAPDISTLAIPTAAPLVWLALVYAAITPGYPIAFAMMAGATLGALLAHEFSGTSATILGARDEFVVRSAVMFCATTGMYVVVRVATEAEARATRHAARIRGRIETLEALDRIDRLFDGSRPIREVIQSVVDVVSREFQIALVSMYLPAEDGRLAMVGVAGYHSPFHVIEPGAGIIGRTATTLTTQFVPDVLADPDYRAARDDVGSEVAVPVVHDGQLVGIVNFEGTLTRPLSTADVTLAELLARSISASLRSARLDEERRERLHAIEQVLQVSRGLVSDLHRSRTVRAVVDAAADLLAAESVLIAGRDPQDRFIVEHQTPADGTVRLLGAEDAAAMESVATAKPVLSTVGRATLALPIQIDDRVAAVLVAVRPSGAAPFGTLELRIADLLASQVAVALRNADRHARVSDAALRDPLTGLLNRRAFDAAVQDAFVSARRTGQPLSLIVLDLDRFSAVNNEHGHATGDAVLRRVADAMATVVRGGDILARYGGEEFVVIAPGADRERAVIIAERIRAAVTSAGALEAAADGAFGPDGASVPVTVSAGVASLLDDELDGRALFRAADSALLTAKRAGRDRVIAV